MNVFIQIMPLLRNKEKIFCLTQHVMYWITIPEIYIYIYII